MLNENNGGTDLEGTRSADQRINDTNSGSDQNEVSQSTKEVSEDANDAGGEISTEITKDDDANDGDPKDKDSSSKKRMLPVVEHESGKVAEHGERLFM